MYAPDVAFVLCSRPRYELCSLSDLKHQRSYEKDGDYQCCPHSGPPALACYGQAGREHISSRTPSRSSGLYLLGDPKKALKTFRRDPGDLDCVSRAAQNLRPRERSEYDPAQV